MGMYPLPVLLAALLVRISLAMFKIESATQGLKTVLARSKVPRKVW